MFINNIYVQNMPKNKNDLYNELDKIYQQGMQFFDNQSLIISGGAIAFILTFLKDIVPIDKIIVNIYFNASVISFGLCIVIGFINHFIASIKARSSISILNGLNTPSDSLVDKVTIGKIDREFKIVRFFNFLVLFFLSFGMICMIYFSLMNIENYKAEKLKQIEYLKKNS